MNKMNPMTHNVSYFVFSLKKTYLLVLSCLLVFTAVSTNELSGQSEENRIQLTPLSFNEKKIKLAEHEESAMQQLSFSRSDLPTEVIRIDVLSGGNEEYCFESPSPLEEIEVISNLECSDISHFSFNITDNCLEVNAGNSGGQILTDTLCLQIEYSSGNMIEYLIVVTIRPLRNLPFVDDFSYAGPRPDKAYWTDRYVFVNNSLGIKSRSVGVATFDGINANGAPYGGGFGDADHLTSTFLNMSSAIEDRCFLTFFIQAGGYGYQPSASESLRLEFKTEEGDWVEKAEFSVDEYPARDSFYFVSIQVTPDYFYQGFQFRFVNMNDRIGFRSIWNLDYVKLGNEFQANLIFENDIAFTSKPSSFLSRYTAMPLNQFQGNEELEMAVDIEIGLFNHFEQRRQADPSNLRFTDLETGQLLLSETLLEVPPVVQENQRDLDPGRHSFVNPIQNLAGLINNVVTAAENAEDELIIRTEYSFQQNEEQIPELQRNNQVVRDAHFRHYYAYDDNSAERGIEIIRAQSSIPALAVQFHANTADTLRGIGLHLPRILSGDANKQYRLVVWGASLEDPPLYESETINPVFVDTYFDSIQGFTTHALKSPITGQDTAIFIPSGDFYVGWKQISRSATGLYVGFDTNTDKSEYVYWFNGAAWFPMQDVSPQNRGAIMIRPVFGRETLISTDVSELPQYAQELKVYPNPVGDRLFFETDFDSGGNEQVEIFNLDGRMFYSNRAENSVDVSELPAGIYVIVVSSENGLRKTARFIKQ